MRELSAVVREVHNDKRLRVRQKQQPNGSVVIYVIVRDKHGKNRWLPLRSSLRDRNGIIQKEIEEKLEEFHRSENSKAMPVATGPSRPTYRRLALAKIDENQKVTEKTLQRKRSWVNRLIEHLEQTDQEIRVNDPRPLRDWVASFEQNSRDRREALSAAVLIYKTAFDGKVFDYDDLKPARRAPQIRKQELSDRDLILLLRRIFEANQTAGSILTWAALSGQRLSAIVCSQWAWELPFELSETEPKKIKLWENKVHRERAGFMWPLWPEWDREFGDDLRFVPPEVVRFRGPWNRAATKAEQEAYSSGLNLMSNWVSRALDPVERAAVDARTLRHRCGQRLLDRGASVYDCSVYLGTSVKNIEDVYSSSYRDEMNDKAKALFADG